MTRQKSRKLPVILNDEERLALLKQANLRYITGHRNQVIMQIMFNLGLRLAEACALKWQDIDFTTEVLMVREGKGRKDRTLYIKGPNWRGEDDKGVLLAWKRRQVEFLGRLPEHVFTTMSKNAAGAPVMDRYIQNMVRRYSTKAVPQKKVSPHTLRHTFATDLYRKTKDIVVVKNALGHEAIATTMVYVSLVGSDVEKALSHQGA